MEGQAQFDRGDRATLERLELLTTEVRDKLNRLGAPASPPVDANLKAIADGMAVMLDALRIIGEKLDTLAARLPAHWTFETPEPAAPTVPFASPESAAAAMEPATG